MIERLSRGKRNLALALLLGLLAWFAWTIRSVLNPVLLGYLCAFILHPFVLRIEQLGFSRRTAVNLAFVGGFLVANVVLLVLVLQVRSLSLEIYRSAKDARVAAQVEPFDTGETGEPAEAAGGQEASGKHDLAQRMKLRYDDFRATLAEWGIEGMPEMTLAGLRELADDLLGRYGEDARRVGLDQAGRGAGFLVRFLGRVMGLAGMFLLVPLYAYYFLFVQKDLHAFVVRHLPKRDRERLSRVAGEIGQVIASFFRGRLGVCFLKGLILSGGLWIAGIDYPLLFGMLSGFLSVIPFFGPFVGFLLAFLVGIPDHGVVQALVRTGIVFGVGEMIEGYVLVPKVLGDSLGLHPLVVFVALLAGGAALGMLGVLIALPLTAALVILVKEFVLPALRDFADEDAATEG